MIIRISEPIDCAVNDKYTKIAPDENGLAKIDDTLTSVTFFGKPALTAVLEWGDFHPTCCESMFEGCENLVELPQEAPDLSQCKRMSRMFCKAKRFNQPIGHWDVSNVSFMGKMFFKARSFNQSLDDWDTAQVLHMVDMFKESGMDAIPSWYKTLTDKKEQLIKEKIDGFIKALAAYELDYIHVYEGGLFAVNNDHLFYHNNYEIGNSKEELNISVRVSEWEHTKSNAGFNIDPCPRRQDDTEALFKFHWSLGIPDTTSVSCPIGRIWVVSRKKIAQNEQKTIKIPQG